MHTGTSRPRRWLLWTIAGILAVAAVGVGAAVIVPKLTAPSATEPAATTDEGDDVSTDPLTSAPKPSTGPLSTDEAAEVARAEAAVDAIVAATDEIGQRGDGSAVGVESIATGWMLGELQAKAREQYDLGYRQTGEAAVTDVTTTAVSLDSDPATIALKVCIDVSGIDVLDAAGTSLKASLYNPGHPIAHLYGAVFDGATWKISTHEIPDEQDCPAV